MRRKRYRVGDWVEIKTKDEILATLDSSGRLDGLPFMPEMFSFCGRRYQVFRRAHKTCDTVFPIRSRWMANAILLDTHCTGKAHGGCEATCPIFWKESWLKKVNGPRQADDSAVPVTIRQPTASLKGCTEEAVWRAAVAQGPSPDGETAYICQATQLPYATTPLHWWDMRQYLEDYTSGNVSLWAMLRSGLYALYYNVSQAGLGLGRPMRWLYDKLHPLWGGPRFPRTAGPIPVGKATPQRKLDLQEGELVRVKSHEEILTTLNTETKNRGMYWDAEMVPYCGHTFRVLKRVNRLLDEKTGKMLKMKGEGVILDGAYCQGRYSCKRLFCPRALYPFWREVWLDRVPEGSRNPDTESRRPGEAERPAVTV